MGIFDTNPSKKITSTFLRSRGIILSYWGFPSGRKSSGKPYWGKDRKFYEGTWLGYKDSITLWWFPRGFKGYVTSFRGDAPGGTLMVVPRNMSSIKDCKIYSNIFTEIDFNIIENQLTKQYRIYRK